MDAHIRHYYGGNARYSTSYEYFLRFCKRDGISIPPNNLRFREAVEEKGFKIIKIEGVIHWEDVELID
jgi:hypothetical protein